MAIRSSAQVTEHSVRIHFDGLPVEAASLAIRRSRRARSVRIADSENIQASCGSSFDIGDFRHLTELAGSNGPFDVVYSMFALHHLSRNDKQAVVTQSLGLLRPEGWFLNADITVAGSPETEQRFQVLRVEGIVNRAGGKDPRFQDAASTRCHLDELEKRSGDQPQPLPVTSKL